MRSLKEVGGYTKGLAAGVTQTKSEIHRRLAEDDDPNEIESYIEGLAGRRDRRLRLKIHRRVKPDGV